MSDKKKTDLRTLRTQSWLHNALRELMNEKPYEKIRVGEITKRAQVSRQTFYLHYESKDDLLVSLFDDVFVHFRTELRKKLRNPKVIFTLKSKIRLTLLVIFILILVVKRIIKLWDRTMHKFKHNVDLWKQYLQFCIVIKSSFIFSLPHGTFEKKSV